MKKNKQKSFIYFRYILPIAATCVMLCLMLVPVYMYNTSGKFGGAVSLGELLQNSWDTVRSYIFGSSTNKDAATLYFSKVLFGIIIGAWTLFVAGFATQICAAVTALRMFNTGEQGTSGRALFLTLVPNRVVLCIAHLLTLPIFFIPMLMPTLYAKLLDMAVLLKCSPFDMAFVALALCVSEVVVIIVSSGYETTNKMNLFACAPKAVSRVDLDEAEEPVADDGYAGYESRAKQEQLQRIMKLLDKNKDNNEENK